MDSNGTISARKAACRQELKELHAGLKLVLLIFNAAVRKHCPIINAVSERDMEDAIDRLLRNLTPNIATTLRPLATQSFLETSVMQLASTFMKGVTILKTNVPKPPKVTHGGMEDYKKCVDDYKEYHEAVRDSIRAALPSSIVHGIRNLQLDCSFYSSGLIPGFWGSSTTDLQLTTSNLQFLHQQLLHLANLLFRLDHSVSSFVEYEMDTYATVLSDRGNPDYNGVTLPYAFLELLIALEFCGPKETVIVLNVCDYGKQLWDGKEVVVTESPTETLVKMLGGLEFTTIKSLRKAKEVKEKGAEAKEGEAKEVEAKDAEAKDTETKEAEPKEAKAKETMLEDEQVEENGAEVGAGLA
ncbi:uncharacterized protein LTR77_001948 [Saxophila tyrrhenica]|uniref:Uncharacterized protein n=1 Tax=Saxophila tyrrhenica TaxID=1690608 RepID=A0AAV9PHL4_9PEZI|nr:hypothetical protein LTR77_001948 [Saxophila tyrrhenica]